MAKAEMIEQYAERATVRRRSPKALTERQRAVLMLTSAGKNTREIAAELGIAEATVSVHRRFGMLRIGADNLAQVVRWADGQE